MNLNINDVIDGSECGCYLDKHATKAERLELYKHCPVHADQVNRKVIVTAHADDLLERVTVGEDLKAREQQIYLKEVEKATKGYYKSHGR